MKNCSASQTKVKSLFSTKWERNMKQTMQNCVIVDFMPVNSHWTCSAITLLLIAVTAK